MSLYFFYKGNDPATAVVAFQKIVDRIYLRNLQVSFRRVRFQRAKKYVLACCYILGTMACRACAPLFGA